MGPLLGNKTKVTGSKVTMSKPMFIQSGLRTVQMETQAVNELQHRIDDAFTVACETLLACEGRVVVTGMGKSGHIGNKIAATLASTGTPAFFVHPGEASHGDLGMITKNDVVLAMSNSGNTAELITLLPLIKRLGIPLISMTGDPDSALAQAACANLDISVSSEACPLNLAPTTSTTVTLKTLPFLILAEHWGENYYLKSVILCIRIKRYRE